MCQIILNGGKIQRNRRKKALIVGMVLVFLFYYCLYKFLNSTDEWIEINQVCYFEREWTDEKTLPNVIDNVNLNSRNSSKNIFFHETSCIVDGEIKLNSRQACAIESAGECVSSNFYIEE